MRLERLQRRADVPVSSGSVYSDRDGIGLNTEEGFMWLDPSAAWELGMLLLAAVHEHGHRSGGALGVVVKTRAERDFRANDGQREREGDRG